MGYRRARSRERRAPPPAEDPPSRRGAATVDRRRSGVPGSRRPAALPRPMDELPRRLRHPGEVAPRALKEETRTCVPPARPPPARCRDQEADRSARSGESPVGLPPDPGRAPEARHPRLGDDHRHGASREPTRPGAPSDRATWAQFLRLQAYGLLSPDTSFEEDGTGSVGSLTWCWPNVSLVRTRVITRSASVLNTDNVVARTSTWIFLPPQPTVL
jgi:hypothetical protein